MSLLLYEQTRFDGFVFSLFLFAMNQSHRRYTSYNRRLRPAGSLDSFQTIFPIACMLCEKSPDRKKKDLILESILQINVRTKIKYDYFKKNKPVKTGLFFVFFLL